MPLKSERISFKTLWRNISSHNTLLSKLKIALFIAIFAYIVYPFICGQYGFVAYLRYKYLEKKMVCELAQEKVLTDSLTIVLDNLKSNSAYIENIARSRLWMKKPGESIIYFKEHTLVDSSKQIGRTNK
jgi:cell division protein FtsB